MRRRRVRILRRRIMRIRSQIRILGNFIMMRIMSKDSWMSKITKSITS